jgi:hypothetical protein
MNLQARVKRTRKLSGSDVMALANDQLLLLVVEDFYPADACKRFAQKIMDSECVERYTHELVVNGKLEQQYFGVDRLGQPFNATYGASADSQACEHYYRSVEPVRERMRGLARPAVTPIDKLRLELDEQCPQGATVASFQGRKMLTGIARITRAAYSKMSAEQPHFDALPEKYTVLDAQLAANIYMAVPPTGGELELWDVPPLHPLATPPDDWRAALPRSFKVQPRLGELILFNCRRPHAVGAFSGADRVSAQAFIGYRRNERLQLWN